MVKEGHKMWNVELPDEIFHFWKVMIQSNFTGYDDFAIFINRKVLEEMAQNPNMSIVLSYQHIDLKYLRDKYHDRGWFNPPPAPIEEAAPKKVWTHVEIFDRDKKLKNKNSN
jgi:hypothetical protein